MQGQVKQIVGSSLGGSSDNKYNAWHFMLVIRWHAVILLITGTIDTPAHAQGTGHKLCLRRAR